MGCFLCVVTWFLAAFGAVKLVKKLRGWFCDVKSVPQIKEVWWGPRAEATEDEAIKPFKVEVSDDVLNDLKHRLHHTRSFVPPLGGIQHQYGLNTNLLKDIVEFWKTQYDWREREKFLNRFPQFTVSVQGLRLHYLHVKPSNPDGLKVLPLLLLHGWPGSVREFYELIPFLTTPQKGRDFVFEVFAPSLPGYGFSEAAVRPGMGSAQAAVLFKNFMAQLGHEKYYVQGGDWGAAIIQFMAVLFPERILGLHSNMAGSHGFWSNIKLFFCSFYPSLIVEDRYKHLVYPLSKKFSFIMLESGYMHLQATKPDTVGVALNDSPVGLAAYILEKFVTWTNPAFRDKPDGGLAEKYGYTKLLDNVMIYWVTNSITTSMRLYAESFDKPQRELKLDSLPVTVPSAVTRCIHELLYSPTSIIEDKYKNALHITDQELGHFPAFERPDVLAKDIYDGFEKIQLFNRDQLLRADYQG